MGSSKNYDKLYYQKNREKKLLKCREYSHKVLIPKRRKEAERKQNRKKSLRKWQNKNREHLNAYMKKWREENKDKWKEISKKAYQKRYQKTKIRSLQKHASYLKKKRNLEKLRAQKNNIVIKRLCEMYPRSEVLSWVA